MRAWAASALLLVLGLTACSCRATHAAASAKVPRKASPPGVLIASQKQAHARILVPARVLDVDAPLPALPSGKPRKRPRLSYEARAALLQTRKLLAAANDLAHYLSEMSESQIDVAYDSAPVEPGITPIWIGEAAATRFGPVGVSAPGGQGLRVVIRKTGIGLYGESDLATSYAIYELLDRLGCRWFMPGKLGEDIPQRDPLSLDPRDDALVPSTFYRGLWYADDDFKRRNRLGGLQIAAGHALEQWISTAQREEHPEWRAQVKGAPHATRLRWSNPEVADAIADSIRQKQLKKPTTSVSLSPADGVDFDDAFDPKIDAQDWDPTVNGVSVTDRLLVLANRVAKDLKPDHPELRLGLLAYVSYTRPPVREKVDPNIVPVIAPITYCRPHPWSDDTCPGAKDLRANIIGWSERAEQLAFRGYAFNLAEPAAPNPMLRKWSSDLPFLFQHKVRYFQPETLPNFETSLPALWLGVRLSWNSKQAPEAILDELFDRFYGHASRQARAYLDLIDHAWTDTPEYSGAGLGYERRFPLPLLEQARSLLNQTKAACKTEPERGRVAMLDESLAQLELYMQIGRNFRQGKLLGLAADYDRWQANATRLTEQYAPNSSFGKTGWGGPSGVYGVYVKRFLEATYLEADRIGREQPLLTTQPLCRFNYRLAPSLVPPIANGPSALTGADPQMDVCTETWSSIGQHDYFGAMWYEISFEAQTLPTDKHAFVWLSRVDGAAQAWLNGQPLHLKDPPADAPLSAEVHLKALTFDASGALHASARNTLSVLVRRTRLAELGAGGLIGPVYLFRDR